MHKRSTLLLAVCLLLAFSAISQTTVLGELKKWHTVRLQFEGPQTSETSGENPFLDYRLNVLFTGPDGRSYNVPGFYAADGNAGDSGAASGSVWEARFSPDQIGNWSYTASFRKGTNIAVDTNPNTGNPVFFNGASGEFTIQSSDKNLPDNRANGRLNYVGERYLKYEETGAYFLKAGADSPENLLASGDFDNTVASKNWGPHLQDWKSGDPTWANGKGKGLIGAVNYLSDKGMNVFSFLTMNVIGDGKDVWPWASTSHAALDGAGGADQENRKRFDVSKLEQWEALFDHAESKGMFLHFKTQETENDQLLDGGELGLTRKLYYRELVARFGHHLALNWNLGEEHDLNEELGDVQNTRIKNYASYIKDIDPYDHHIVVHSYPNKQDEMYQPLLGATDLTGPSIQTHITKVHDDVKKWVQLSASSGKKWVVSNDEQGGHQIGVSADQDYSGDKGIHGDNRADVRHMVLWGTLMAGGTGVEYYFGYETGETDLTAEDWRSRQTKWEDADKALKFFRTHVPFWEMNSRDELISGSGAYCLAKPGEVYLIYLPSGGSQQLDLNGINGEFEVEWFNPRSGGNLLSSSVQFINGNGNRNLGAPPSTPNMDWVVLVRRAADSGGGDDSQDEGCEADYEETDGLVIIEAEDLQATSGWQINSAIPGYTGDGYIDWRGGDSFNQPGNGLIQTHIKINLPGTYRFRWRSKVGMGSNSTEANDTWLRFPDAADFFGRKGSSIVYPKGSGKSPIPEGAGADGWFKVYLSGTTEWTWNSHTSDNDGHDIYVRFDAPGIYTLEISGRSDHHLIDRLTLALDNGEATDLQLAPTPCRQSENENISVTGVTVNPAEAELEIGESLTLNAAVQPSNATQTGLVWSVSDPTIASITNLGQLTALSPGEVTVTVETVDGGFKAYSTILVLEMEAEEEEAEEMEEESGEMPAAARLESVSASAVEGSVLTFDFELSRPVGERTTLSLEYQNGTASKSDYLTGDTQLTFEAGSQTATLSIQTLGDLKREGSETFTIRIIAQEGEALNYPETLATGTILDDDQQMQIAPNPAEAYKEVSFSNVQKGTYAVEIYSPSGNLQQRTTLEVGEVQPSIILGNLSRGMYIVKLLGISYSYTAKLIVK